MPKFVLDESVSPRIAKHLARVHDLDVLAFPKVAKLGTPDPDVRALARRLGRVLITLDSDFSALAELFGPTPPGIIWLHPPQSLRTLEGEKRMLDRFFDQDAPNLDLENSIIEVSAFTSTVLYPKKYRRRRDGSLLPPKPALRMHHLPGYPPHILTAQERH